MPTATAQAPGANVVQNQATATASKRVTRKRNPAAGRIASAAINPGAAATLAPGNNALPGAVPTIPVIPAAAPSNATLAALSEAQRLQALLERTQQENAALREAAGHTAPKLPATDAQLTDAIAACIAETKKNPGSPQRSLAKVLEFVPLLTDAQKAQWKAGKAKIEEMHDTWARTTFPKIVAHQKRALSGKLGKAGFAGRYRIPTRGPNKGKVTESMFRARLKSAPKADGKPDLGKARSGA